LLEELRDELVDLTLETTEESKATVYLNDAEDNSIELSAQECTLLLSSESTVERFHEALGSPSTASITLCEINPDGGVLDALEKHFSAVDEE
jgi:hypothetical protein